jgi:hypothetical protein
MISWGASVSADPGSAERVLVFGADVSDVRDKRLMLARAPRASLARFETWEFRTRGGWATAESDAVAVASGMVDEFSVSTIEVRGRPLLMLTQAEPNLGPRLMVRFAERAEGPWSNGTAFHTCPEPASDPRLFVYSGKAHPELARRGPAGIMEIPVTYCVNSSDFASVVRNVATYRPRIVPLGWDVIEAAAASAERAGPSR